MWQVQYPTLKATSGIKILVGLIVALECISNAVIYVESRQRVNHVTIYDGNYISTLWKDEN